MEKLKLTIFIPPRMGYLFADLFSDIVEKVIFHPDEKEMEGLIRDNEFEIALEYQYGYYDHRVLDLVKKYKKRAKVILCLNWTGKIPKGYFNLGYYAYMDVPAKLDTMIPLFGSAKKAYYTENR